MSIRHRLFLLLFLASALVVASSYLLLSWSFKNGFLQFVEGRKAREAARLADRLAPADASASWTPPKNELAWASFIKEQRHFKEDEVESRAKPGESPSLQHKPAKFALLDAQHNVLLGDDPKVDRWALSPIRTPMGVVGYVGTKPVKLLNEKNDLHFAEGISQRFAAVSAVLTFVCAAVAWWFSGFLIRPIQSIADGVKQLATGNLDARVPVSGKDEFAYLSRRFNEMASRMQQSDLVRREWLANVAHELRTPLGLLRAELEAIEDGVRRTREHGMGNALSACNRLENLVSDLAELACTDKPHAAPDQTVDLGRLVQARAHAWSAALTRRSLLLTLNLPEAPLMVMGQSRALEQVMDNLMSNWIRYTEAGGHCGISMAREGNHVVCRFHDSGPGVEAGIQERLFERFFRAEPSRSRVHGGAGLGLAICRQIVQAHGGSIHAATASQGGLEIRLVLPAGALA